MIRVIRQMMMFRNDLGLISLLILLASRYGTDRGHLQWRF